MAIWRKSSVVIALVSGMGCGGSDSEVAPTVDRVAPTQNALIQRAYIVSKESEELTVIDLDKLEIVARVPTGGVGNHMAELSNDYRQLLVTSSATDEAIVVDAVKLEVAGSVPVTGHPTHVTRTPDDRYYAVMEETTNEIAFIDGDKQQVAQRIGGFQTPHFMRFSADGNFGYVANIGGNSITRVDMQNMAVMGDITLDDFGDKREAEEEGGFADAQIARDGTIYAAHHNSGKVLAIDSKTGLKLKELTVGSAPWIAFSEHPFPDVALNALVPNFGDKTVSIIDGREAKTAAVKATLPGDEEAYGVNFTSVAPDIAFVMNRVRQDIAVVNTARGELEERIDVGGNTETASTTPDGKLIVATVSSADRVVVIDTSTRKIIKTFNGVGKYPWSVTIPKGQNYCH